MIKQNEICQNLWLCQYYCMDAPFGLLKNREKARWELHKDAAYYFEQIVKVTEIEIKINIGQN